MYPCYICSMLATLPRFSFPTVSHAAAGRSFPVALLLLGSRFINMKLKIKQWNYPTASCWVPVSGSQDFLTAFFYSLPSRQFSPTSPDSSLKLWPRPPQTLCLEQLICLALSYHTSPLQSLHFSMCQTTPHSFWIEKRTNYRSNWNEDSFKRLIFV